MAEQKSSHPTGGTDPADWVERLSRLYTPVVADVLDRLGYRNQCLRADIRPLVEGFTVAGVARTVLTVAAQEVAPAEPYKGEMAAVDALRHGDVMVVSSCDGSFWGELLSTAARYRGCRGIYPADSMGRIDVVAHDVSIVCGGVSANAHDLVLADDDGVVIVPLTIAEQALAAAEQKVRGENLVRLKLAEGMTVTEAFRRYGVL